MATSDSEHERFWSTVHRTLENLKEHAPQGFTGRVQVAIGGEEIQPAGVGRLGSWVYFEVDEGDADTVTEERRVVFVRPEYIGKVEVRYVREEREVGFHVDEPKVAGIPQAE